MRFLLKVNAIIEVYPVMRLEDLAKVGGAIKKAVEKYGSGA